MNNLDVYWYDDNENATKLPKTMNIEASYFTSIFNPTDLFQNIGIDMIKNMLLETWYEAGKKLRTRLFIEDFIKYVVNHREKPYNIHTVLFDFCYFSYLENMCWIRSRNERNEFSSYLKGIVKNDLRKKLGGGFWGYLNTVKYINFKSFVIAPELIKRDVFTLLINLYHPHNMLSEQEFNSLCKEYLLNKHWNYEKIISKDIHPLGKEYLIDCILHPQKEKMVSHLTREYSTVTELYSLEKNIEYFTKGCKWDDIPYNTEICDDKAWFK